MIARSTSSASAPAGRSSPTRLITLLKARGFSQIGSGVLDVTLYRDDAMEMGPNATVGPTEITINLDGQPLLLIDDVLYTGRSARAALNALIDFGRPSVVRLAVLVDRGGRELPISADFTALTLSDIPADHRVNVHFIETDGRDEIVVEPM